ncbi:hypothetical protein [Vibrio sp. 10N.239.312.D08]|uniref:AbrB/MazE/SpoVT family DNA-binding domain-containing protein n=1 Tax=Vibrio sp. 10N.239.312.D08 TaxID=3229978 RepID=UPI00354CC7F9
MSSAKNTSTSGNSLKMEASIGKWGNNLALRINKSLKDAYQLNKDDPCEIQMMDDGIFVRFLSAKKTQTLDFYDVRYGETVAIEPNKITRISLSNTTDLGSVLVIQSRVAKVKVSLDWFLKKETNELLTKRYSIPADAAISICLEQLSTLKKQAGRNASLFNDSIDMWAKAEISWSEAKDPLKDPAFLEKLTMIRSQLSLNV